MLDVEEYGFIRYSWCRLEWWPVALDSFINKEFNNIIRLLSLNHLQRNQMHFWRLCIYFSLDPVFTSEDLIRPFGPQITFSLLIILPIIVLIMLNDLYEMSSESANCMTQSLKGCMSCFIWSKDVKQKIITQSWNRGSQQWDSETGECLNCYLFISIAAK